MTGSDAELFLQGQLTQDMRRVTIDSFSVAAYCSPKGRVLTTLRISRVENGFILLVPTGYGETLVARLGIFRLRAKVDFAISSQLTAAAVRHPDDLRILSDSELLPEAVAGACKRRVETFAVCLAANPNICEVLGSKATLDELDLKHVVDDTEWALALIDAGIVRIDATTSEQYTPHMLSLDLAGAISFEKGCYTGQEIIARTEHLGKSRRRLRRYECDAPETAAGDELFLDGKAVGNVVNVSRNRLLAVTPAAIHQQILQLNGNDALPLALPWD